MPTSDPVVTAPFETSHSPLAFYPSLFRACRPYTSTNWDTRWSRYARPHLPELSAIGSAIVAHRNQEAFARPTSPSELDLCSKLRPRIRTCSYCPRLFRKMHRRPEQIIGPRR